MLLNNKSILQASQDNLNQIIRDNKQYYENLMPSTNDTCDNRLVRAVRRADKMASKTGGSGNIIPIQEEHLHVFQQLHPPLDSHFFILSSNVFVMVVMAFLSTTRAFASCVTWLGPTLCCRQGSLTSQTHLRHYCCEYRCHRWNVCKMIGNDPPTPTTARINCDKCCLQEFLVKEYVNVIPSQVFLFPIIGTQCPNKAPTIAPTNAAYLYFCGEYHAVV